RDADVVSADHALSGRLIVVELAGNEVRRNRRLQLEARQHRTVNPVDLIREHVERRVARFVEAVADHLVEPMFGENRDAVVARQLEDSAARRSLRRWNSPLHHQEPSALGDIDDALRFVYRRSDAMWSRVAVQARFTDRALQPDRAGWSL